MSRRNATRQDYLAIGDCLRQAHGLLCESVTLVDHTVSRSRANQLLRVIGKLKQIRDGLDRDGAPVFQPREPLPKPEDDDDVPF